MTVQVDVNALSGALAGLTSRIGVATAQGAMQGALVYEQAMKEEIRGGHAKNVKTGATPGGPPQNVTGNLRRQIGVGPLVGTGLRFTVDIGPSADYAGYLEQGTPRMPAYPFVKPAAERVERSGVAHAAIVAAWRQALAI